MCKVWAAPRDQHADVSAAKCITVHIKCFLLCFVFSVYTLHQSWADFAAK